MIALKPILEGLGLGFLLYLIHLAMQAIHAALIREGTCVTSGCCDYCIVGDRNPMAAENGLLLSVERSSV